MGYNVCMIVSIGPLMGKLGRRVVVEEFQTVNR